MTLNEEVATLHLEADWHLVSDRVRTARSSSQHELGEALLELRPTSRTS